MGTAGSEDVLNVLVGTAGIAAAAALTAVVDVEVNKAATEVASAVAGAEAAAVPTTAAVVGTGVVLALLAVWLPATVFVAHNSTRTCWPPSWPRRACGGT